ncbi:hypothetical protein BJY52DRAFT_1206403 [Lactarius psammicola]|nr:hypothetical protein BJY52DRAFT_1206403 [Lactarius psammicola]
MTTAWPCHEDSEFLQDPTALPTQSKVDRLDHDWSPFEDRLTFDWAHYHYVTLQSSAPDIAKGLNLWSVTSIKHGSIDGAPWKNAKEMYAIIDTIQTGSLPFKAYSFSYTRPKPSTPSHWMEQTYKLNACDVLSIIQEQLATPDFKDQINYAPYKEFNSKGECVWSNLMSRHWAFRQADELSQDQNNYGVMFVPIVAGSDKTTVLVATGHQEYHPVYISLRNLTNTAQQAHGNSMLPVAFLPIPKTSKSQQKCMEFQHFCHQLYHNCLEVIFEPLRCYMTTPTVVKCPDGQFRHAIFRLGPYIADYPEQVWLAGIVSNWCNVTPDNLDSSTGYQWTHEKTNYLIKSFDSRALWDAFGVYEDVVPFTHSFPHADIHELLPPDLLHQLIKGVFKDHLVTWVGEISIVPSFLGLWQFPEGHNFNQWMGDDSKALMKVYLGAIAGYLPPMMVHCISTFIDACYVTCRNAISASALKWSGVCMSISLPHQHALSHYALSIQLFGSPNGLCSSITESKHIKAVKEPWQRSSWYNVLPQILWTLVQLEKMAAHHHLLASKGLMKGMMENLMPLGLGDTFLKSDKDGTPVEGINEEETLSIVVLSATTESGYPHSLEDLANNDTPDSLSKLLQFHGRVRVHHLAVATFFAPSDLCGTGGMLQEWIRSTPSWYDHPCHDTVYVVLDDTLPGMEGIVIARVYLFFSFQYKRVDYACAFVNWLVRDDDEPDLDTGASQEASVPVIDVRTIACATHLLPIFGSDPVPSDIQYYNSLDRFKLFFVNAFVDHHAHVFLTDRH